MSSRLLRASYGPLSLPASPNKPSNKSGNAKQSWRMRVGGGYEYATSKLPEATQRNSKSNMSAQDEAILMQYVDRCNELKIEPVLEVSVLHLTFFSFVLSFTLFTFCTFVHKII